MSLAPGKTLREELISTKLESSVDNQLSSITNSKLFSTYENHFNLFIEYENTKTKNDPITEETNFWVNNIDKFADLEPEFVLFWTRKLVNSNPIVLEDVKAQLNIEDTTLQTLSDSIANIFDQDVVVDSRYTPIFDVDFESNTPIPYNHIIDKKINLSYKANIVQASTRVNSLFNNSMINIAQSSSPSTAHGGNLVTDISHFLRLAESKPSLYQTVAQKLNTAFETFVFLSNYKLNNVQNVINVVFERDVEGTKIKVDLKDNKLQETKEFTTPDLLS